MSTTTPNLGLFKYDTTADANSFFDLDVALNGNWDILDAYLENIQASIPITYEVD